jgi:fatty-acyl-CoA synthase
VRVAIWLENRPEWVEAAYAARHRGALAIAVNTRYRAREVQDILRRSQATAVVVSERLRDELAQVDAPALEHVLAPGELEAEGPDRSDPDAPWMVFTSSGTTGAPKLVVHTQGGIDAHAAAVADSFGYREPDAVVLCLLPLCGVFGFCTLAGALAAGCPYVLLEEFDAARASALIAEHRVTHTTGTDEMIRRLLEHDTGTLREAGFAAFNLEPRALVDAAHERGIALYQCYGASEMQALVAHAPRDAPPERRAVAGGRPISDAIAVRVRDEEIQVRGPNVMAGYLGDDEATREAFTDDGFYRSGDLGRETEHGFEFVTRRGDALRLAGFLVEPREIESFLETLDGVEAAQVVEVEGRPVAFVIGDAKPEAVVERCQAELAGFKAPRTVIGVDAFPTTPSANGERVQRAELRRRAVEALQPD